MAIGGEPKPNNDNELFKGDSWTLSNNEGVEAEAVGIFEDRLKAAGWNEEDVFDLKLSFDEALINAMKHGNKFDANKKVFVTFSISNDKVSIHIKDEGEGFNPEKVPSPLEGKGLTKGSGRGVLLMKGLLDSVTYNEKGNEVTMVKTKKVV